MLSAWFGARLARSLATAAAIVLSIMMALTVGQASANGPHGGAREVFRGTAGPYHVVVRTAPRVGNMHLSIYLAQVVGAKPVSNARVRASAKGPPDNSRIVAPTPGTAAFGSLGWYGVNLAIPEEGDWVFTLTAESSLGAETVDFTVRVRKAGGVNWGFIAMGALALGALAWWALGLRRKKGRQPQGRQRG